ncbi:MAG: Rpn family recombination-promoting nuclease/putative transposase [Cellulosilyticaceae bacterium]
MNKIIEQLNLNDDFLFAKVMSDKEICRKVLEKILNIKINRIEMPTEQKVIDILLDSKAVRLDIYVNDEMNTIYNIEMQKGKRKNLAKRSRYYQGSIDLDLITKGEDYKELQKSFVIFICTFDPFDKGRHLYTFENRCKEDYSLILGDETTKLFLNTQGILDDVDTEMIEFLTYIEESTDAIANAAKS